MTSNSSVVVNLISELAVVTEIEKYTSAKIIHTSIYRRNCMRKVTHMLG